MQNEPPLSYFQLATYCLIGTVGGHLIGQLLGWETHGETVIMANLWFWYALWLVHHFREKRMPPYNRNHTHLK